MIYLEHLQNLLFAGRLIARHNGPDDGSLLYVSFEIVRHVLIFWLHNARFHMIHLDFIWMVSLRGSVFAEENIADSFPLPGYVLWRTGRWRFVHGAPIPDLA